MARNSSNAAQRSPRSPVYLVGEIGWDGHSVVVRIRNVSEGGALVEGDEIPTPGSAVRFRRGDLEAPGVIAWSNGRFAGIAFDAPLAPRKLLRRVAPPQSPVEIDEHYRRPGFRPRRLSQAERSWIEALGGDRAR